MTALLIYITTHRVAVEDRAELDTLLDDYHATLRDQEPDLLAHHAYYDESGTELTLVQVQRDTDAAERHMKVAGPLIARGVALTAPVRVQVYGVPGPIVAGALQANGDAGAEVVVAAEPTLFFTRAQEEQ